MICMQLNLQQLSNVLRAESHFLKFKYEIILSHHKKPAPRPLP